MALLLTPLFGGPAAWLPAFKAQMPELEVRTWPELGDPADIEVAAIGGLPGRELAKLPNLKLIVSLMAGTDMLLGDPALPDVPIVRCGDPEGDAMMNETALLHVLRHHRDLPAYEQAQRQSEWLTLPRRRARERRVGVLGLGAIGQAAAQTLADHGFQVAGWVRQPRLRGAIEIFHGRDQLAAFLARSEIVVNLLPLTPETDGILCAETFRQLPKGAAVINLGRGAHIVDADLVAALDSGHLAAATLDVFRVEPLPKDSPFWRHPKITVVPHAARRIDAADLVPRICDHIRRLYAGQPLSQIVERGRGY
ncbi:MAG: 2-hydroxyacid dehydrogenase [Candidatus Eiseniibacteriota bacterium]